MQMLQAHPEWHHRQSMKMYVKYWNAKMVEPIDRHIASLPVFHKCIPISTSDADEKQIKLKKSGGW